MTTQRIAEMEREGLMDEVQRYLAAVEVFRAEGREPHWTPEEPAPAPARRSPRRRQPLALS
jgi:hypothetical protein